MMRLKQFKKRHGVVLGLILAFFTASMTVILLEFIHPISSKTLTAKQSNASITSLQSKPVNRFDQQLLQLSRLYRAAPVISIDQLTTQNRSDDAIATDQNWEIDSFEPSPPKQYRIPADPTNFGNRLQRDIKGRPVKNDLLVVLHETTSASSGAINTMLTPHPRDEDQVSYHTIIQLDGTIIYTVDPRKRAYGAGDSAFKGAHGIETVQTKKKLATSVNNFAYHISLESPSDGIQNNNPQHSGYSHAQYNALAWLVANANVKRDRITTHVAIDKSGQRQDPRSFDMASLRQNIALQTDTLISLEPQKYP